MWKDILKDSAHTRRDRDVQNEYITRARKIRNMPRDEEFVKAAEEYLKRYKATFGNTIGGTGFRYVSIMGEIEKDNLAQSLKFYKESSKPKESKTRSPIESRDTMFSDD